MKFHTRRKSEVLDDLTAKFDAMARHHPDRPTLRRMIIELRGEIERRPLSEPESAGRGQ